MRISRVLLTVAVVSAVLAPAMASDVETSALPDGQYACASLFGGPADFVELRGHGYRLAQQPGAKAPFAPFSFGSNGTLSWSHGFGDLRIISSRIQSTAQPGFSVSYQSSQGRPQSLECTLR